MGALSFAPTERDSSVAVSVLLTVFVSVGWFLCDGNIGINFADEGYLWYGIDAVREGLVPVRDFHAYDPGRYLWSAGLSYVLGDGLLSLRLSCVIFQCFGVLAGMLSARRVCRHPAFLVGVSLLLCAWMHPRYKVFEQSIALMAVYAGVLLIERPTLRRHFGVGVFGGISAFMGRNHGAYHVVAFGVLITWISWGEGGWRTWFQRNLAWGCGLLAGYLPQWLMFLFCPGYFAAFLDAIRVIAAKGTNLSTEVPWPWRVPENAPVFLKASAMVEGCFYILLPAFLILAVIRLVRLGRKGSVANPVLLATTFVTLPYAHYVFSRPDIVHLGHGAPTLLLGTIALAASFGGEWGWLRKLVVPLLVTASLLANLSNYGATLWLVAKPGDLVSVSICGGRMLVTQEAARVLASAGRLASLMAKPGEAIFFGPHHPALYAFTGRRSPTRQIYFIFPATPEEDRKILAEIELANVKWAILQDYALDGRDDLRFCHTNPAVFDYFRQNFRHVPMNTLPKDMVLLVRISH